MTPNDPRHLTPGQLNAGLTHLLGSAVPDYADDVVQQVARTRQRPAWTFLERWLPVTVITRPALSPPMRLAWLLLIALLAVALTTSVAIVGSRLLTSNGADDGLTATALIPQGDEAVFAFASYADGLGGDIYTVRADGTDVRQLTSGPGAEQHPTWSPDGKRIAYRLWQDRRNTIAVMDAGGGNPITLATSDVTGEFCAERWNLAWSPDGTSLIFPSSSACQSLYDLFIVKADGSSPATRLLSPGTNSLYADWSPDGTRLAFLGSEDGGSIGLYVVEVAATDALAGGLQGQRIGPELGPNLAEPAGIPRWSPDGTQLAAPGPEGIFVVEADGSGHRLLVADATNPAWSPDGQQVAFHRVVDPSEYWNGRTCTARTWIIDADGSNERQLDELADFCGGAPRWSPDGTRLASLLIASTPEDPELTWHLGFVMVDGSSPPVLLPDAYGSWQPVVAPLPPAPSFAPASPAP